MVSAPAAGAGGGKPGRAPPVPLCLIFITPPAVHKHGPGKGETTVTFDKAVLMRDNQVFRDRSLSAAPVSNPLQFRVHSEAECCQEQQQTTGTIGVRDCSRMFQSERSRNVSRQSPPKPKQRSVRQPCGIDQTAIARITRGPTATAIGDRKSGLGQTRGFTKRLQSARGRTEAVGAQRTLSPEGKGGPSPPFKHSPAANAMA